MKVYFSYFIMVVVIIFSFFSIKVNALTFDDPEELISELNLKEIRNGGCEYVFGGQYSSFSSDKAYGGILERITLEKQGTVFGYKYGVSLATNQIKSIPLISPSSIDFGVKDFTSGDVTIKLSYEEFDIRGYLNDFTNQCPKFLIIGNKKNSYDDNINENIGYVLYNSKGLHCPLSSEGGVCKYFYILSKSLSVYGEEDESQGTHNTGFSFCEDTGVLKALRLVGIVIFFIKILVPLLLIVFGCIDFAKSMMSSDEKQIKKSATMLAWRSCAGVVIFLLPTVLNLLTSMISSWADLENEFINCKTCIFDTGACDAMLPDVSAD